MNKLRLVKKENLEKIVNDNLKNDYIRQYIYIAIQDVLKANKINMDNITKRCLKHFEDRIKDNKYDLSVYYEKVDRYTSDDYMLKFYIHTWDENKKEWFNFSEQVYLKSYSCYRDVEILTIEKIDDTLKHIENRIAYYSNLLNNIDDIVNENNKIYNEYQDLLNKYSDNMYNQLQYIIENDKYY